MPSDVTLDYQIDTVIKKLNLTLEYQIDTVLLTTAASDYLIDILIRASAGFNYLTDVCLANRLTSEYSIDVEFFRGKFYSLDTIFFYLGSRSVLLDTIFKSLGIRSTYSIDTKIAKVRLKSYSVDVIFSKIVEYYDLDVIFLAIITSPFSLDTVFSKPTIRGYSIDTTLVGRYPVGYSIDVVLYEPTPKEYIARGWQAKIKIDDIEVGTATDVTVRITKDIEEYYSIESPIVKLVEGPHRIEGSIRKAWVNVYYLRLLGVTDEGFSWDNSTPFNLEIRARRDIINPQSLFLYNCRFTRARITVPQSGWLEEEYDFIAEDIIARWAPTESPEIECPPGEKIENGDFETADWDPWEHSYYNVYLNSEGGCPPSNWFVSMQPSGWISQTIPSGVPVDCVYIFSMNARKTSSTTFKVKLTVTYLDETTSEGIISVDFTSWTPFDLESYLTSGKVIKVIKFECTEGDGDLDNISIQCE